MRVDLASLTCQNEIANNSVLVPRRLFEIGGLYDPHVGMRRLCDWDLWLRIAFKYPVDFVDEPLASWRWRPHYAEDHHEITLLEAYKIILNRQPELSSKLTEAQNNGVQTRLARISFSLGHLYRRKAMIPESMEWIQRSMDHDIFTEEQRRVFEEIDSVSR